MNPLEGRFMASLIQRSGTYYIQYCVSSKARRVTTGTDSLQVAKAKLRQFESARAEGTGNPLPTRTPIADVVAAYVGHIRVTKTAKSAQTDSYYLREMFGPICPALEVVSRKQSTLARKRPPKPGQDRRRKAPTIEAASFEAITTAQISDFITAQVESR